MKKIAILVSFLALSACSSNAPVSQINANYQPESQARVRLYGQNGHPTIATYGIDCSNGKKGIKINVGGGMGDALGSFVGAVSSKSIGIPETEISKTIGSQNGVLSKAFFQEIVVPANKAVNAMSAIAATPPSTSVSYTQTHKITRTTYYNNGCQSKVGSFIPEAGHDYEVVGTKGSCGIAVYEIAPDGSIAQVELGSEVVCSK